MSKRNQYTIATFTTLLVLAWIAIGLVSRRLGR